MNTNSSPSKYCDIVMKGGITSGVVYPAAVVELSKTYHFKNIGGTSAGAIAAAATAAAEYGRQQGAGGFDEVARLPHSLGAGAPNSKHSRLFSLFQPQAKTRALFRLLTSAIGNKPLIKFVRVPFTAVRLFWVHALIGALPGLLLVYLALPSTTGFVRVWSVVCGLILALLGLCVMVVWGIVAKAKNAIPANCYGLCKGYGVKGDEEPLPLTPWLSRLVNRAAGLAETGAPLTFGQLWGTEDPEQERKINLQMMTTNLTYGRPYRLPFTENVFLFDPAEWKEFFPPEIMKWLEEHPHNPENADQHLPLRQLPAAVDFPVVVAARLSLSFPGLMSAVPIYAVDYGRKDPKDRVPEKCWFSDGGICSNFPVHFFDSALPRWPTFGINLRDYHRDYPDSPVWMPNTNKPESEWRTNFDQGGGIRRLSGFVGTIITTMQNWTDNTQSRLPGFRDRVAHISLDERKEGGMNLNMPPPLIDDLSKRGRSAAAMLMDRFTGGGHDLSWDNHRWIRYRSLMQLLEQMFSSMAYSVANPMAGERSYFELIRRLPDAAPNSYRWRTNQQALADQATEELLGLVEQWSEHVGVQAEGLFGGNVPKPRPELRVRPKI